MESNFFRCLVRELGPALQHSRINKVFMPDHGVWSFELWNGRSTTFLLFRAHPSAGALFLSHMKPANPAQPPAEAMWLRKRLKNRELLEPAWDWPGRRLAWALNPGQGRWLVLDIRRGPSLQDDLDDGFGADPDWPDVRDVADDHVVGSPELFKTFPQLSPPLRKALQQSVAEERAVLIKRLRHGACDGFWLHGRTTALPWPPRGEGGATRYGSALEAAAAAGQPLVFGGAEREAAGDAAADGRARMKRLRRSLRRMDKEEERLQERLQKGDTAALLQAQLYRLDPGERRARVALDDYQGGETVVALDPTLTVTENMAALFKDAGRAKRGMRTLAERRAAARQELEALQEGRAAPPPKQQPRPKGPDRPRKSRGKLAGLDVARFRSSDGFLIIRGKNSKANHKLLSQAASPFDLWFHAQDGPGAHAVLKLDHPGQEPPRRTLEEAAALAGLKSWQATEEKARVMCARVADVRKVKGLAQGQVVVDAVLESLLVELDPALEERLRIT